MSAKKKGPPQPCIASTLVVNAKPALFNLLTLPPGLYRPSRVVKSAGSSEGGGECGEGGDGGGVVDRVGWDGGGGETLNPKP